MIDFKEVLDTCPNFRISGVSVIKDETEFRLDTKLHAQMNAQCAEQYARELAKMATWKIDWNDAEGVGQGVVSMEGYFFSRDDLMRTLWAIYIQGRRDAGETVQPEMPT